MGVYNTENNTITWDFNPEIDQFLFTFSYTDDNLSEFSGNVNIIKK